MSEKGSSYHQVDRLASHFGACVKDLNYADPYDIAFAEGVTAQVAREVIEAYHIINLPKLKTHFERRK